MNVAGVFLSNLKPGAKAYRTAGLISNVSLNVQIFDHTEATKPLFSIRQRRQYSLQVKLENESDVTKLPWFCLGDILVASDMKPTRTAGNYWRIYTQAHSQLKRITYQDIIGGYAVDPVLMNLASWSRNILQNQSLLSSYRGKLDDLSNPDSQGIDLIALILEVNTMERWFVIDEYRYESNHTRVYIRKGQEGDYLLSNFKSQMWAMLRNVTRFNSKYWVLPEQLVELPEICYDIQEKLRLNRAPQDLMDMLESKALEFSINGSSEKRKR